MTDTTQTPDPTKPAATSMTLQGGFILLVSALAPILANLFHVQVGDINNLASAIVTAVSAIASVVGAVMVFVGRMRAVHKLT